MMQLPQIESNSELPSPIPLAQTRLGSAEVMSHLLVEEKERVVSLHDAQNKHENQSMF